MKKAGILGGMGPESTILYYRGIVRGMQERLGPDYYPELVISSVDMTRAIGYCEEKRYAELTEYLLETVQSMAAAGAGFAAMASNTPHVVYDELAAAAPIPIISIVESACKEAQRLGCRRVSLMGTKYTMTTGFYQRVFQRCGIEVVIPSPAEIECINSAIYGELVFDVIKESTAAALGDIISRMKNDSGIEAVILGCTELPLILSDENSSVHCVNTVDAHIKDIIGNICG